MKTVGRRGFQIEKVRHTLMVDENVPGWSLARYSRVLLPHLAAQALDAQVLRDTERATARHEARAARARKKVEEEEADELEMKSDPVLTLPTWCTRLLASPASPPFRHVLYSARNISDLRNINNGRAGTSMRESSEKKRMGDYLARWSAMNGIRELAAPVENWRDRLDELVIEMPNFAEVIDYLRGEFALAELIGEPVQLSPFLLDGPPGVGKTKFARGVASLMQTPFGMVSMETAQTATALSGSEEYWSNSKPGMLFNMLMENEYSNPVMLIDEVDKGRNNGSYDPLAALYTLLEPSSAKTWFDLAIPLLKIDASKVIWVLTSNDKTKVPKPLLTRMRVFDIAALDAEQSKDMAVRIFSEQLDRLPISFTHALPPAVIDALAATSPREMQRITRELVAKAVLAGRRHVLPEDLGSKQVSAVAPDAAPAKTRMVRVYAAEVEVPESVVQNDSPAENDEPAADQAPAKMKMH